MQLLMRRAQSQTSGASGPERAKAGRRPPRKAGTAVDPIAAASAASSKADLTLPMLQWDNYGAFSAADLALFSASAARGMNPTTITSNADDSDMLMGRAANGYFNTPKFSVGWNCAGNIPSLLEDFPDAVPYASSCIVLCDLDAGAYTAPSSAPTSAYLAGANGQFPSVVGKTHSTIYEVRDVPTTGHVRSVGNNVPTVLNNTNVSTSVGGMPLVYTSTIDNGNGHVTNAGLVDGVSYGTTTGLADGPFGRDGEGSPTDYGYSLGWTFGHTPTSRAFVYTEGSCEGYNGILFSQVVFVPLVRTPSGALETFRIDFYRWCGASNSPPNIEHPTTGQRVFGTQKLAVQLLVTGRTVGGLFVQTDVRFKQSSDEAVLCAWIQEQDDPTPAQVGFRLISGNMEWDGPLLPRGSVADVLSTGVLADSGSDRMAPASEPGNGWYTLGASLSDTTEGLVWRTRTPLANFYTPTPTVSTLGTQLPWWVLTLLVVAVLLGVWNAFCASSDAPSSASATYGRR